MKNIWVVLLLLVLPRVSNAATDGGGEGGGGSGWQESFVAKGILGGVRSPAHGSGRTIPRKREREVGHAAPAGNTMPLAVQPSASRGAFDDSCDEEFTARTFNKIACWHCHSPLGEDDIDLFGVLICATCSKEGTDIFHNPSLLASMPSAPSLRVTGEKSAASTASDDTWPAMVPGISFICYACSDGYEYPTKDALEMHWRIASIADPRHRENAEKYDLAYCQQSRLSYSILLPVVVALATKAQVLTQHKQIQAMATQ
jgi:hypothetical protein